MVRNYIRRSSRQSWDEVGMEKAIEAVKNKSMGIRKASLHSNVPKSTLRRRVNGLNIPAVDNKKILGSKKPILSNVMENELAAYIIKM